MSFSRSLQIAASALQVNDERHKCLCLQRVPHKGEKNAVCSETMRANFHRRSGKSVNYGDC